MQDKEEAQTNTVSANDISTGCVISDTVLRATSALMVQTSRLQTK